MTRKLGLVLSMVLVLGMVLAVSCGGGAASTATVTVTKTAAPGATSTVTVTQTAAPVTVTVTPTPTPPKLVKVRESSAAGGSALFFAGVGQQQGYFAKRNIDYALLELAADAARVAPFLGQAEISNGDVLPFYPERKDARIIGRFMSAHQSILVRKDSPYQSYQDLKGKKMGILGPATGQYQMVKTFTKLEGLTLEKDFQLLTGVPAVQIGWLLNKEVEAIHLYEPFVSKLLVSDGDKVRELYWLDDLYKKYTGTTWLYGGIYTTDDWAKKNPDLARQVGLAYNDVLAYIYAHNEVWKSDLAKKLWQTEDPKVLELLVQRMPRIVDSPPYGPAYKAALIKKTQLVADAGLLPQEAVEWFKGIVLFAEPW